MRSHTFLSLALLGIAALPHAASAQLLGTSVTGTLRGNISPTAVVQPNYFDPSQGRVPDGYSNKTQGTTVTVAEPAVEFGYADGANTVTANITDNQVILSDFTNIGTTGYTITLTDPGFTSLVKVSDTFGGGGVTATKSGNVLTFVIPVFFTGGPTIKDNYAATFGVVAPAAVPEPGSVALLVGMGISGAGFLVRRKRRAGK